MKIKTETPEHTALLKEYVDMISTTMEQHGAVVKDSTSDAMIHYLGGVFYYTRLVDGCPKPYISLSACCKGKSLGVASNRTKTTPVSAVSELENFIKFVEEKK